MPAAGLLPPEVACTLGDVFAMEDGAILDLLSGHEGFMYMAGLDDRSIVARPAYPKFRRANVDQCLRLVRLARQAGARRVVVCGSYFTWFDRQWPEMRLAQRHCYIRSRVEQREAVLAESRDGMETAMLELPYIFGTMPGRKPLWTFLVDMLARMGKTVWYPLKRGGTAMVTVSQVARAAAGALERAPGGRSWPIGGVNMPWSEFIPLVLERMGTGARAVHCPKPAFRMANLAMGLGHALQGRQGGLSMTRLADLMYREAYIDPAPSMDALVYGPEDIHDAIRRTVDACLGRDGSAPEAR